MRVIDDITVLTEEDEIKQYINNTHFYYDSKRRSKIAYLSEFITFDIETTTESETVGYPYTYQFTIGNQACMLRLYSQFVSVLRYLISFYQLGDGFRVIIYVHNLGYEMFYLWQLLNRDFTNISYLAPKSRKPLTVIFEEGLEFRDSLKLFQKSLASATKGCVHAKMVGDLDYSIHRTPSTYLSNTEFRYCIYDVVGLREAIIRLYQQHGYTTATVPLTNTGIVRESVLKSVSHDPEYRGFKLATIPDKLQMELLIRSMAGGDTHGSRFYAGRVIENCNMVDIKSAHPSQMLLKKYPCGKLETWENGFSLEFYEKMKNDFAMWMYVRFNEISVKSDCANPVISLSKCMEIGEYDIDNGRIIYADFLEVPIDSNDLSRILRAYEYDSIEIKLAVTSKLKYLPISFRAQVKDYFSKKESIVDKEDFEYMFSKICVNSIYGVAAQKPTRDEYTAVVNDAKQEYERKDWDDVLHDMDEKEYQKKVKNEKALPFVWGTWTASLSRLQLFDMQEKIGWNRVLYWDTDSIYYYGNKADCIDDFNNEKKIECEEREAVVLNRKGKEVYIGSFEDDYSEKTYGIERFKFLHAKCYAKEVNGKVYFTIAGVSKQAAEKYMSSIDNLTNGFYIPKAGGSKLKYIPLPIRKIERDHVKFDIASHIVMSDRDYIVNDTRIIQSELDLFEQEVLC